MDLIEYEKLIIFILILSLPLIFCLFISLIFSLFISLITSNYFLICVGSCVLGMLSTYLILEWVF